jgi:hypothetical protein
MNRSPGYVGKLEIAWEDGEKNVFEVSQKDGFIWIGDHVVSPRNEKNMKGVLEEIGSVFSDRLAKSGNIAGYSWSVRSIPKDIRFTRVS